MKKTIYILFALACASLFGAAQVPPFQVTNPANLQVLQYNATTGTWQNSTKMALGAAASGSTFGATPVGYVSRTDAPAGIVAAFEVDYNAAFLNSNVGAAGIFVINDTGSASGGADPHLLGLLGYASNNAASSLPANGAEARLDDIGLAQADTGAALLVISNKANPVTPYSLTGRKTVGVHIFSENYQQTIGGTPLAQGETDDIQTDNSTGGDPTLDFSLIGGSRQQVSVGAAITSGAKPGAGPNVNIHDDGVDAWLQVGGTPGTLRIDPGAGAYVAIQQGLGFAHLTGGTLGIVNLPWGETYTATVGITSGSNKRAGTFTLSSGAATVSNTSFDANSVVVPTLKTKSGTITAQPWVDTATPGTGFTVKGSATDNSTYNFVILEVN